MKLSVVIICWNDSKVILDCLRTVYENGGLADLEVIVSDNGSTDGSVNMIRSSFPQVRIVENGRNLGFAGGNNAGLRIATGEYVLILNPDTLIHEGCLARWVLFAEGHSEAGAFGCRVLNRDGSYQNPARPLPTTRGYLIAALYQRWLGGFSEGLQADRYTGWDGRTERTIGFQSGCCLMVRGGLLKQLGGFDERFFYHFEETDLCKRIWDSGSSIRYCPDAVITHLGGQSVGRFPVRFALETCRNRYRYFHKYYGFRGVANARWVLLLNLLLRNLGYGLMGWVKPNEALRNRLKMYQVLIQWNWRLNTKSFIETGDEPDLGYEPLHARSEQKAISCKQ